jgi:hypothetical protein
LATRRILYAGIVPGASEEACRVEIMNANWIAGADGEDGAFKLTQPLNQEPAGAQKSREHKASPAHV